MKSQDVDFWSLQYCAIRTKARKAYWFRLFSVVEKGGGRADRLFMKVDGPTRDSPVSSRHRLRALIGWFQAVLVDMEEGVVSEIMKGPLADVFDHRQLITDVSGSGNNWWVDHVTTGTWDGNYGTLKSVNSHLLRALQGSWSPRLRAALPRPDLWRDSPSGRVLRLSTEFPSHPLAGRR